jgi:hypothetical protein
MSDADPASPGGLTSRSPGPLPGSIVVGLIVSAALVFTSCSSSTPSASPATPGTSRATGTAPVVTAAPETKTPGDIPDTTAYVTYVNSAGGYRFDHPEGWVQTEQGTAVTLTDKFNGVSGSVSTGSAPPTIASAQSVDVPALRASQGAFELRAVSPATLPAGSGVLIVYRRNSPPDPVTGRSSRVEVQRYEIYGNGHVVVLELYGAVGADNVDPYRRMSQSLHIP